MDTHCTFSKSNLYGYVNIYKVDTFLDYYICFHSTSTVTILIFPFLSYLCLFINNIYTHILYYCLLICWVWRFCLTSGTRIKVSSSEMSINVWQINKGFSLNMFFIPYRIFFECSIFCNWKGQHSIVLPIPVYVVGR